MTDEDTRSCWDLPNRIRVGLPLAKRIVESHNGTLSASNHPEDGAALTISLSAS